MEIIQNTYQIYVDDTINCYVHVVLSLRELLLIKNQMIPDTPVPVILSPIYTSMIRLYPAEYRQHPLNR